MTEVDFYHYLFLAWIGLAAATFAALFFIEAPYGRFSRKGFGPLLDRRIGWIVMELPAVLAMPLLFALSEQRAGFPAIVFLVLWEVHYLYRTFIFPFRMRGELRRMALTPVLLAVVFNVGNGYLNGRYLFGLGDPYPTNWLTDPRFIVGVLLFAGGFAIHIHADHLLRNLRAPGETGYKIPRGGLFNHVSGANYLGEIVEWGGFALATWSPGGLAFFVWTIANLAPRARSHHRWYKRRFADYPPTRRALIPFVW